MTIPSTHSAAFAIPGMIRTSYKVDRETTTKCFDSISDIIPITKEMIVETVCKFYGVSPLQLFGKCRNSRIIIARHMCRYFLYEIGCLTYVNISKMFSSHHTTVMSGNKFLYDQIHLKVDNIYKTDYFKLKNELLNKHG